MWCKVDGCGRAFAGKETNTPTFTDMRRQAAAEEQTGEAEVAFGVESHRWMRRGRLGHDGG